MKTKIISKCAAVLILSVVVTLVACGKKNPTKPNPPTSFDYTVDPCTNGGFLGKIAGDLTTGSVEIYTFKDTIMVEHSQAFYNDCADVKVEVKSTKDGYEVSEKLEGDTATCSSKCDFNIITYIYHLSKGNYNIVVIDAYRSKFEGKWMEVNPDTGVGPQP